MYGSFFFVRNPVNAMKKYFTSKNRKAYENSPLKTANLTKNSPHSSQKDAGALR